MTSKTGDIENRPKELLDIPNYGCLPDRAFKIDLKNAAGEFLAQDLFDLDGTQPIESKIMNLSREIRNGSPVIKLNPSREALDFYRNRGDTFKMINIIVSCHSFQEKNGEIHGLPYHISLKPASKGGKPQVIATDTIALLDLDRVLEGQPHYMGYNPFSDAFGLSAIGPVPVNEKVHSDVIGFVYNSYFLAAHYDKQDVCSPGMCTELLDKNRAILKDYQKFRTKKYFGDFNDTRPIKIWGCDSPIELFLLQAMSRLGLNPKVQMRIFPNGSIFPSLQSMWENGIKTERSAKIITEADFFFENEKIAIFCDSIAYHTSGEAIAKDNAINQKLMAIGIQPIRIMGSDIARSPFECARRVLDIVEKHSQ